MKHTVENIKELARNNFLPAFFGNRVQGTKLEIAGRELVCQCIKSKGGPEYDLFMWMFDNGPRAESDIPRILELIDNPARLNAHGTWGKSGV